MGWWHLWMPYYWYLKWIHILLGFVKSLLTSWRQNFNLKNRVTICPNHYLHTYVYIVQLYRVVYFFDYFFICVCWFFWLFFIICFTITVCIFWLFLQDFLLFKRTFFNYLLGICFVREIWEFEGSLFFFVQRKYFVLCRGKNNCREIIWWC